MLWLKPVNPDGTFEVFFPAMGTLICLIARGEDAEECLQAGMELTLTIEDCLTRFRHSDISELNERAGFPVVVSALTDEVLLRAHELQRETLGVFDVTLGSGVLTRLEPGCWQLSPAAQVDLGGIGKGFTVDKILQLWGNYCLESAVANFGQSSMGFLGKPPDGCWKIGIRDPNGNEQDLLGMLRVQRGCLSTSSQPTKVPTPVRAVDPATGERSSSWCSVTCFGPNATSCEAWSTALLARGESLLKPLAVAGLHSIAIF